MMIPGPIEQNAYGKGGAYECLHIQKKSMTVKEYKKKIECFEQVTNNL
jgi:jumonji domain-containing protein 2